MNNNIPDYSKYSVRQLVDVYQRIEKDKYPEKVRIITEQLYSKLSLDNSTDIHFDFEFDKSDLRYGGIIN